MQNSKKEKEKREKRVRPKMLNKSFPSLILIVPLSQVYSQTNKKVISNIKLKRLKLNQTKLT